MESILNVVIQWHNVPSNFVLKKTCKNGKRLPKSGFNSVMTQWPDFKIEKFCNFY